jgi:hypothetical protein
MRAKRVATPHTEGLAARATQSSSSSQRQRQQQRQQWPCRRPAAAGGRLWGCWQLPGSIWQAAHQRHERGARHGERGRWLSARLVAGWCLAAEASGLEGRTSTVRVARPLAHHALLQCPTAPLLDSHCVPPPPQVTDMVEGELATAAREVPRLAAGGRSGSASSSSRGGEAAGRSRLAATRYSRFESEVGVASVGCAE